MFLQKLIGCKTHVCKQQGCSMKKLWPLFFLMITVFAVWGQNSPFTLVSASSKKVILHFRGEPYRLQQVNTPRGTAQRIITPNGNRMLQRGLPALPQYTVPLLIPRGSRIRVTLHAVSYHEKKGLLIAPSKGNVKRNILPDSLPFFFGKVYTKNAFYPDSLWQAGTPYFLGPYEGQTLTVYPFAYNPVTQTLRVYDEVTFEITFFRKPKSQPEEHPTVSGGGNFFRHHFINALSPPKAQTQNFVAPHLLIISYGPYIPLLKNFILWKRQTGYKVRVIDVTGTEPADSIKATIQNIYRDWGLQYVLLVGDAPQVPSGKIAGNDADNFYAYVSGNDHYPDLFVGRFPAATASQLRIMVQRSLAYEKAESPDTGWYTRCTGIASEMGPGYHHLMDFQHIRIIDTAILLPSSYRTATELFDGSQGKPDAPGDPDKEMLTTTVEQGTGIINYCGHGSALGWNTTRFGNAQVSRLKNMGKWPLIISVSCATGDFVHQDCFAEAWLRAAQNGEPTGAVAAFMPTTTQGWDPPMCAQQYMNALLTAADSLHPPRTFGAICMEGCIQMNDVYGTDGYQTTDTWVVFGDPSLQVRTATPLPIRAQFKDTIPDSRRVFTVQTSIKKGIASLSGEKGVYAVAPVKANGQIKIPLDSVPAGIPLQLTITAWNHRPFFGKVIKETVASISKSVFLGQLNIFPNPSKGTINITLSVTSPQNITLSVSDISGKTSILFSGFLSSGIHHFHYQAIKPGIYICRFQSGNQQGTKKLIVLP